MTETTNRKIISRRPMRGFKANTPLFAQVEPGCPLSAILNEASVMFDRVFLCGSLEVMTREYVEEPLKCGATLEHSYTHKHRAPVYRSADGKKVIEVKLVSHRESWFPDCEDRDVAWDAWKILSAEWKKTTGLPLLSSPSKTGQAYLWEMLPKGVEFPSLPSDVERIVRANSPQHRIEQFAVAGRESVEALMPRCVQYDGRWMYANLATIDRLPIGEPRRVGHFEMYVPGWYQAIVRIPKNWNHIGLLPVLRDDGWEYPSDAGEDVVGWFTEPELTLAIQNGWEIMSDVDGYAFDKGRPLCEWARKLIEMRDKFLWAGEGLGTSPEAYVNLFAGKAVRQILNHTIGSLHARGYEREKFLTEAEFRTWRRENAYLAGRDWERVEGGYLVPVWEPNPNDRLAITMPHWSGTIWALERERMAKAALKCDPATLVKVHGDALYSTERIAWIEEEDKGRVGQLRRKA